MIEKKGQDPFARTKEAMESLSIMGQREMKRLLTWVNGKLSEGFYFPAFVALLRGLEQASLNFWIKTGIKGLGVTDKSGKKAPRWVSELYQTVFILIGVILLALTSLQMNGVARWVIVAVLLYRLLEIMVFMLNWIFAHNVQIHQYRRSIVGSMLNVLELALYFSVIGILLGCFVSFTSKLSLVFAHLKGVVAFSPPDVEPCTFCNVLSGLEFLMSVLLVLVVIGALVGTVLREEIDSDRISK